MVDETPLIHELGRRTFLRIAGVASAVSAITLGAPDSAFAAGAWGGYENGKIPAGAMSALSWNGILLEKNAAADMERLNVAFKTQFGQNMSITGGYRSYELQVSTFLSRYSTTPSSIGDKRVWNGVSYWRHAGAAAAVPGTSNHGWGMAVDFTTYVSGVPLVGVFGTAMRNWVVDHGPALGWISPTWAHNGGNDDEAWHFEYTLSPATGPDPDDYPGALAPLPVEEEMAMLLFSSRGFALLDGGLVLLIGDQRTVDAYKAAGVRQATIADADFDRHLASSKATFLLVNTTRGYAIWSGGKATGIGDMATVNAFKSNGVPVVTIAAIADFDRFVSA